MKSYKYILPIALLGVSLASCDDLFEPANEMITDASAMYNDPQFAAGLMGNAYLQMPYQNGPGSDMATDDAVSNENGNSWTNLAGGAWSAQNDPLSQWQARNNAIQYLNIMLENVGKVVWSADESINAMFIDLFKGDALGMRAMQRFYLLRAHAGKDASGELMGVPLFDESQSGSSNFNTPRLSYSECVKAIIDDLDAAIALLPENYVRISDASQIPAKYKELGATMSGYNRAFGDHHHGKVCGQILKAIKAQVLLYAASPAFETSGYTWEEAAKAAAQVIIGKEVVADGHIWYSNTTEIDNVKRTENTSEALWMTNPGNSNNLESDNFPPSIGGNGRCNPTQNLVDAFPAIDGYPISVSAVYDETNPYANRDPRLALYIVTDGSTMGINDDVINTNTYTDGNINGLGAEVNYSTRTGYYMRKLLRSDVNMTQGSSTQQKHYTARIRWTEMFLNYAEAANEAYGPTTAAPGTTQTAKSVIKAIRERAGICVGVEDGYLNECAADKAKMRELIHNERRIELCFENHRFYDLRRWNANLNETAKGINIKSASAGDYEVIDVDTRNFKDYMIYGPIPYSEIIKFNALTQNQGW